MSSDVGKEAIEVSDEADQGPEPKLASVIISSEEDAQVQSLVKVPCSSLPEYRKRGNSSKSKGIIILLIEFV